MASNPAVRNTLKVRPPPNKTQLLHQPGLSSVVDRFKRRRIEKTKPKHVNRPGRGREKGQDYERLVCKELSLWYSGGEDKAVFWRTASSGAKGTHMVKKGHQGGHKFVGDIGSIGAKGEDFTSRFLIECKHYKTLNLDRMVAEGTGQLVQFWLKAKLEAQAVGKKPFLIARQNALPILVGLEVYTWNRIPLFSCYPYVLVPKLNLVLMTFSFFKLVNPALFCERTAR